MFAVSFLSVESKVVGPIGPSTVRSIKRLVRFSRKPLSSVAPRSEFAVWRQVAASFVPRLGLSLRELSKFTISPRFPSLAHSRLSTGTSPSNGPFGPASAAARSNDPRPYVCRLVPECRVESGRADRPFHRPLNQTARAVFPQAAFLSCSSFGIRCVAAGGGLFVPRLGLSLRELSKFTISPRFPSLAHSRLSTGTSPSNGPFGPASAAARSNDPRPYVCRLVPEYYSPIRFLTPRRPEFRSRLYPHLPRRALGRCLSSRLPALSSAGATSSRPYLPLGRYQASLGHSRLFSTVSPAHTLVRWGGTNAPSPQ